MTFSESDRDFPGEISHLIAIVIKSCGLSYDFFYNQSKRHFFPFPNFTEKQFHLSDLWNFEQRFAI